MPGTAALITDSRSGFLGPNLYSRSGCGFIPFQRARSCGWPPGRSRSPAPRRQSRTYTREGGHVSAIAVGLARVYQKAAQNELASLPRRPILIENECDAKAILPNPRQPLKAIPYQLMSDHDFLLLQIIFFPPGIILLFLSLLFHVRAKDKAAAICLFTAGALLFLFAAALDPFLNLWDERFHALVAKNLMRHPCLPTLVEDPVLDLNSPAWDRCHVWLHKQPLFLWPISLSFYVFGLNEFALRLPSVLLGVLMVAAAYRTAALLFNSRVAFLTAMLFFSSNYLLELVAGRQLLEHNDIAFVAYITFSLWAWIEYLHTDRKTWILATGVFAGCALLCKWAAGLVVYLAWLVFLLTQPNHPKARWKYFLLSVGMTLLVFCPWQLFAYFAYPQEMSAATRLNFSHFREAIHGHDGPFYYHFFLMNRIFGPLTSLLLIPAAFVFRRGLRYPFLFWPWISMIVFVYLFFSLAKTKMPSFTLIVALPIYLMLAALIQRLLSPWENQASPLKYGLCLSLLGLIFIHRFSLQSILKNHSFADAGNGAYYILYHNKVLLRDLKLPADYVLFTAKGHHIEAMFYTGLPAYDFLPTEAQCRTLTSKGRKIAVWSSARRECPPYLTNHPSIFWIKAEQRE